MTSALSVLLVALLGLHISTHAETSAVPYMQIVTAHDHSSFLHLPLASRDTPVFTPEKHSVVVVHTTTSNAYDTLCLEHSVRAPPIA